ncbi:MAG: hypothetical protein HY343_11260 [Lentisphaerae bacterium]|nr:hypothetical protein [Lentisphaerota bacterium]
MMFAVVFSMAAFAFGQNANITVEGSALVKGQVYTQTIEDKTVSKQPSWDPLKEKCPLDPNKAVQLAVEKLTAGIPNANHLKLASISLIKVPSLQNKWHYFVNFFEKLDPSDGEFANVIVSLDGTVPPFVK